jgi:hypothetical protein
VREGKGGRKAARGPQDPRLQRGGGAGYRTAGASTGLWWLACGHVRTGLWWLCAQLSGALAATVTGMLAHHMPVKPCQALSSPVKRACLPPLAHGACVHNTFLPALWTAAGD